MKRRRSRDLVCDAIPSSIYEAILENVSVRLHIEISTKIYNVVDNILDQGRMDAVVYHTLSGEIHSNMVISSQACDIVKTLI